MEDGKDGMEIRKLWEWFRRSEHWAVSLARDILSVIAVVVGIALVLFLLCGTWPAIVTIESTSMVPHMNVGDLVVVVQQDRFGDLQTWEEGKMNGYRKFGDYGDVIIYRPNGIRDFWSSVGLLPLSKQHPIIHRAMTWISDGDPEPAFINTARGQVTPSEYVPLSVSNITLNGYTVLYTGTTPPPENISAGANDLIMKTPSRNYLMPASYLIPGTGYIRYTGTGAVHGGYITKGDNNIASDQGYLAVTDTGTIEPVRNEWVVGKSLFVIPFIGLLPLHITEVVIAVVIVMLLYEIYQRRRNTARDETGRKDRKTVKKRKDR